MRARDSPLASDFSLRSFFVASDFLFLLLLSFFFPLLRLVSFGAHGAVEEFDYVHYFLFSFLALDAGAELQEAAGVGGDDDFGLYCGDVLHFVVEQG